MAVDTPAKLAIVGAGPIGLETALYARFLGYDVVILEQGAEVAAGVKMWGHVSLFTPFAMLHSSLGVAAISTHDETYQPPKDEAVLTGEEWRQQYLLPLAQTDLLSDHIRTGTRVVQIGKYRVLKGEMVGVPEREDYRFRMFCVNEAGEESIETADVVIDTTGVIGNGNWLGEGGLPALGERGNAERIERGFPDILGQERANYAGKHTLLVGGGMTAATHAVQLRTLLQEDPATQVTWVTRWNPTQEESEQGPIAGVPNDPLEIRRQLTVNANTAATKTPGINWLGDSSVAAVVAGEDGRLKVSVEAEDGTLTELVCDKILASVGFHPDREIYRELQVHECYASEGPMRLAAKLLRAEQAGTNDCLSLPKAERETLITSEPHFYVLGSKSFGRRSNFLFQTGIEQVKNLFQILGERETLDLYATSHQLREQGK